MRELIDHTVLPDPWKPYPGDVYQRMNADGYERLVVIAVGLDEVNHVKMVLPDGSVKLTEPYGFRCRIVCLGMVPAGRMKTSESCRARVERDKSRAEVATLQEHLAETRADLGRTRGTLKEWIGAHEHLAAEFTTLRDAARTLLPADSTPNPATGWLADVIRSTGSTIADLRAALDKSRGEHQEARRIADGLRGEVESLTGERTT